MDMLDIAYLETMLFTSIFGVFGIYHLLSFFVLKHKVLFYYSIVLFGMTLHWSLYFFTDGMFGDTISIMADKASLSTAMITTLGLLLFTRNYLNINGHDHPKLFKVYRVFIGLVATLPLFHFTNNLIFGLGFLNDAFVLLAALMAMLSIFLNILSGLYLFRAHQLNRYYLYSHGPILLAALLYIGTWFLKRRFDFDAGPMVTTTVVLVTVQLVLFSILIGYKFKTIEEEAIQIQLDSNTKLQHEIDKKTKKLQIAKRKLEVQNAELEQINQLKNKLFSLVAHDVRTPLSNFISMIDLMETELKDSELKPFTVQLKNEISDRVSMVDNLLQWSYKQLDGMTIHQKVCDVKQVFDLIANEFERSLEDKNISLEIKASYPKLLIDENMFKVILRNLISNAIKFSQGGQKIVLWSQYNEGYIDIGVRDFGVGMNADWIQNLENNGRPRSTEGTKGEKGTGLGLLIVKDFVAMNGGTLRCESEVDKGSNFIVRFNIAATD
tara:strand:- start:13984 stop:15468 length:1485 start_codon:yes stop_codon:yes gene_type:complete